MFVKVSLLISNHFTNSRRMLACITGYVELLELVHMDNPTIDLDHLTECMDKSRASTR